MATSISRARALFVMVVFFLLALAIAPHAHADGNGTVGRDAAAAPTHTQTAPVRTPAPVGRSGLIPLQDGTFNLNVPTGYRFYSAEDAYAFMQRNGAATPSGTVLGMIAPANERVDQRGAWATIVSYQDIGYVQASTASGLSSSTLEGDVRAARQDQRRPFEGFSEPPAFDTTANSVAWGERAAEAGAGGKDLRYEQKLLGRKGVVGLTSIGSADQSDAIKAAAPDMLRMVSFAPGNGYGDFQPATDTVSTYTVPALVTGVAPAAPETATSSTGTQTDGQSAFGGLGGIFPWIALGLVVVAGAGFLLTRRRRDPNLEPDEEEEQEG